MRAVTRDGGTLLVKIYGRDAWDGQLLSSIWSFLWYRDETPTLTLSRLQQVEHEAFVTLLAERAQVPVLPVVAAGPVANDALLVVDLEGEPLSSSDGTTDEMLADLWRGVDRMHRAGIAHGALDADRLVVQSGRSERTARDRRLRAGDGRRDRCRRACRPGATARHDGARRRAPTEPSPWPRVSWEPMQLDRTARVSADGRAHAFHPCTI